MKLFSPKLILSVLSLALVVTIFVLDSGKTSPGELSPVHAGVKELAGDNGCDRCHGGLGTSMGNACLDCHKQIRESLDKHRGLHGNLAGVDATNCAPCHAEHHGAEVELSGARAFAQAGVPERDRYDHAALGFLLEGKHAQLGCVDCHKQADAKVLAAGQPRFLGLAQDCASCHTDPHQGRMTSACADCHGQSQPFAAVAKFDHGQTFASRGAHARAACLDCHPKDSPRSVEVLGGKHDPLAERTCLDCHASPHQQEFVNAFAASVSLESGNSCVICHDPERGAFSTPQLPTGSEWHAASGFALSLPHAEAACQDCHADDKRPAASTAPRAATFAARYPGRKPDDCAACHADPHGGQFARDRRSAQGCLGCHERTSYRPAKFDAAAHARTAFPLEGAHANAACSACHERDPLKPEAALIFADAPTACSACHLDAHDGRFARPQFAAQFPKLAEQGCAACHDAHNFTHDARLNFDHSAMAGFTLDGAHAKADCAVCHLATPKADSSGRRFGRAAEQFHGDVGLCSTCHADVHAGEFDTRGPPSERERTCARCHTTSSFHESAKDGFDHAAWTGFALNGAHALAACEVCHATLPKPTAEGRTFARASEKFRGRLDRCDTCHKDPHRGRFERSPTALAQASNGRQSCARCHTEDSFRAIDSKSFDHAAWTGFELVGAHAETMCAACHTPGAKTQGRKLGPAPGTACNDCHADPHAAQFDVSGKTDCARCHVASATFTKLDFDHQKDARFALDATHAKVACAACHLPQALAGGTRIVRYRPLGTTCADCHGGAVGGKGKGD